MGIYDAVLGTVQEDLRLEGTPDDVPAALDLARIETQAQGMAPFLKSLADCKELSALRVIVPDYQFFPAYFGSDHRSHGPLVMSRAPGSALADHPLDGAMVQVLRGSPATVQPRSPARLRLRRLHPAADEPERRLSLRPGAPAAVRSDHPVVRRLLR